MPEVVPSPVVAVVLPSPLHAAMSELVANKTQPLAQIFREIVRIVRPLHQNYGLPSIEN